ncbi:type II and III secretion system protein family protein [Chelativorans sp. EGI FJ00035]|uniref:Type II and III secretion system protein family protein n=2 Tax=Chelativorans salis TaxID=2978478 RepID=A0ABT2LUJ0_9HYPH|nr:type II and III secretion system protein family protein [Chelativorans sp. EGI FJ00035]
MARLMECWSLHRIAAALAALFIVAFGEAAQAQTSAPGGQVDLHVGQGRIFRFEQPVESVLIADTSVADLQIVSADVIYVFGLKPGTTNLIAVSANQQVEAYMQLQVSADSAAAAAAANRLQPTSMTELTFLGDRIVALGRVRDIGEAVDIDNVARSHSPSDQPPLNNTIIDGSQQVNIRVRFAEVSRSELQAYGLDWNVTVTDGSFNFGLLNNVGDPNLGFGIGAGNVNIEVLLEALQRNEIVKILAEPNLTAVSGQTASFLAGGEVPVPIPQGNDTIAVEYKPFGVSLRFTPTLIGNNRIALNVRPEVSTLSDSGGVSIDGLSLPSFVVRRADTTVEVASGQTFAIAGLFQQRLTRNLQKVPVLADVPVLGALFQSQRYQRQETELVILITPHLVNPVSGGRLATPLDRPAPQPRAKNTTGIGLIVK